ncbi:MAG: hypothetical protein V1822_01385 [Candidatus Micrarchaeota archaeon]
MVKNAKINQTDATNGANGHKTNGHKALEIGAGVAILLAAGFVAKALNKEHTQKTKCNWYETNSTKIEGKPPMVDGCCLGACGCRGEE